MKRRINIVVTCSKRKRLPPAPDLRLRDVFGSDTGEGFATWIHRLSTSKAQPVLARDLYAGEHWSVVRTLEGIASSSGFQASIWICSAGYGLIALDAKIKPYSATFSPNHADTVYKWSIPSASESPDRLWWRFQTEWEGPDVFQPRSIKDIAAKYPNSFMLIVASRPYLSAILDDVSTAMKTLHDTELFCIVSAGTASLPGSVPNLLPCSAKLQAEEGGSLNSLNVRLARTILTEFRREPLRVSVLRAHFNARIAAAPPLRKYGRKVITDNEAHEYILAALGKDPKTSWTIILRRLRDSGRACSQERFASLFKSIKSQIGT